MTQKISSKESISKSIAAGIMISIGGWVFLSVKGGIPGSVLFSVGLMSVCIFGLNLFTGKVSYFPENKTTKHASWLLSIYIANVLAAIAMGLFAKTTTPGIVEFANAVSEGKLSKSPLSVFMAGIACNFLIFVAVDGYKRLKGTTGLILIVFCVSTFILIGAEHCIADAFYFSTATNTSLADVVKFMTTCTAGNIVGGMGAYALMHEKGE